LCTGTGGNGQHVCTLVDTLAPTAAPTTIAPTSAPSAPTVSAPTDGTERAECLEWNDATAKGIRWRDRRENCNAQTYCRWYGPKRAANGCDLKEDFITDPPTYSPEEIATSECSVYRKRRYCRNKADAKTYNCVWVDNECVAQTGAPTTTGFVPSDPCDVKLRGECLADSACTFYEESSRCYLASAAAPPTDPPASPTSACETLGPQPETRYTWPERKKMKADCLAQTSCRWTGSIRTGICFML
jgi:hypothetical protein